MSYTGSANPPTLPTLEKLKDKGPAMTPLEGRTDDYALLLCNALACIKMCYSGPAPKHGMTFDDGEVKCEVYMQKPTEATVKTLNVPAMVDAEVVNELIVSVSRLAIANVCVAMLVACSYL